MPASGVINRGAFGKALWPGINAWYGYSYNEHQPEWVHIFSFNSSGKAFEEDVGTSGLGLASVKPEGEAVAYDSMSQAYITRYTMVTYGLGFIITDEMIEDDQYAIVAKKRSMALARSMRETKENVAANVINRAFNTTYTGGDGSVLSATDHSNFAGGTWQNRLTTDVDMSEAGLEQAVIDIGKWKNDRGLQIAIRPEALCIPVDIEFETERVLKSPLRPGTAENDINAVKSLGKFPKGVYINHYFSDTDAWFIKTNSPDGMKYFERRADDFDEDNDFDTGNLKYKATARYAFGWTDPRGFYGSSGV